MECRQEKDIRFPVCQGQTVAARQSAVHGISRRNCVRNAVRPYYINNTYAKPGLLMYGATTETTLMTLLRSRYMIPRCLLNEHNLPLYDEQRAADANTVAVVTSPGGRGIYFTVAG